MMKRFIFIPIILLSALLILIYPLNASAAENNKIELKKTSASIGVGETAACIRFKQSEFSPFEYIYKSSDKKTASVNKSGIVTGKKTGTVKIIIKKGKRKAEFTVHVRKAPKQIALTEKKLTLGVGETWNIKSTIASGSAAYARNYTSSDPGIAAVNNGAITAVAPGSAVITVNTYNGKKADCFVTVKNAPTAVFIKNENNVIEKGSATHKIDAELSENSASKKLTYEISDKSIASVSKDGFITGKKKGSAVLRVTTYNGITAEQEITVKSTALSLNASAAQAARDYNHVERIVYGKSAQKRKLEGYVINPDTEYKKTLLITFALHGYEDHHRKDGKLLTAQANAIIQYFAAHNSELKNYRLIIVPCANPDGTIAGKNNKRPCSTAFGRCTAKHVDINRDFGKFRAVETRKLRSFILDSDPDIYIDAHGWLNETIGTKRLCNVIDKSLNLGAMLNGQYCSSLGYAIGWVHKNLDIPCCLLEYKSPKALSAKKDTAMIKAVIREYS